MQKYDAIVVGAGITGLLTALVLGKHGSKVLVLEKNPFPGGNCNSYMVDGYQVDVGVHAITHLIRGPFKRLMENYFDYIPVFENFGQYYIRTNKRFLPVPSTIKEFVTFDVIPRMDRLALTQALTKALTFSTFGIDLAKHPVSNFLPKNLSPDTYDFVNAISYSLSGKDMYETSAQRVLEGSAFVRDSITPEQLETILQVEEKNIHQESILQSLIPMSLHTSLQTRLNKVSNPLTTLGRLAMNDVSYSQGYPRKGLKSILNSLLYSLPANVEMKLNNPVSKIIVQEGKAKGVIANEKYLADIIIHTGYAKELPKFIDDLSTEYIEFLNGIVQSKSLTIWLGLNETLETFNYIGSEIWYNNKPYWAMPISNYDSSLAPKGKQLVGFSFVIDSDKSNNSEIKKAYESIYQAVPEVEDKIEMQHEQVIIPEKAAVTIDGNFADIRTPIKNLYVAGTDADKRSMGITRAGYSVIELMRVLKSDGKLYRRRTKHSS